MWATLLFFSDNRPATWAVNLTVGGFLAWLGWIDTNLHLLGVLVGMVCIDALASVAHRAFGPSFAPEWHRAIGVKFVFYIIFLPAALLFGNSNVALFEFVDEGLMGVALVTEFTSILLHLAEIHENARVMLSAFRRMTGRDDIDSPREAITEALEADDDT